MKNLFYFLKKSRSQPEAAFLYTAAASEIILKSVIPPAPSVIFLFHGLFNGNSHGYGSSYHGVVTHTDESHHFHVGGNGRRTGELSV